MDRNLRATFQQRKVGHPLHILLCVSVKSMLETESVNLPYSTSSTLNFSNNLLYENKKRQGSVDLLDWPVEHKLLRMVVSGRGSILFDDQVH